MSVLSFDRREATLVTAGDRRWFLLEQNGAPPLLVDGVCMHRGGPLHLGDVVDGGTAVRCPWHDRCTGVRALRRRALPLVVRGDTATAVVPGDTHHPVTRRRL